jgi:hypothetical protein
MCQKMLLTNIDSMQSEGGANHFVSIGINFGFTLLSIIPTWIVLSELEGSHEVRVTEEDVQEDAKLGGKA